MPLPLNILTELCSIPTAPFAESHIMRWVEAFVARRPHLRLQRDAVGNLLIESEGASARPRWVFAAHMDHPGFIARSMSDARTVEADFYGGVLIEFFKGSRVRFFAAGREVAGVITDVADGHSRDKQISVKVRVRGTVSAGSVGMWDEGPARVRGRRFQSRVCDNLAGAASALTMLDRVTRGGKKPATPIAVLLTRAEEEGFIGAIFAATRPKLLKKSDCLVVIECSARQPYAPQGGGAILRVGDRTSIFHSGLTYFIGQQADALTKKDKSFKFQRALMPGGTCEATVYDVYGFTAASVCVPLGNYHNMDKDKNRIGPEYIDLDDWENMVKLFIQLAREGHAFAPGHKALRDRLVERYERWQDLLTSKTAFPLHV